MATTSWAPAWDQDAGRPRIIAAQVNASLLDPWFVQQYLPVAQTPMTGWLFSQTGYVPPTPPTSGPGGVSAGREWPRQ